MPALHGTYCHQLRTIKLHTYAQKKKSQRPIIVHMNTVQGIRSIIKSKVSAVLSYGVEYMNASLLH